MNIFFKYTSLLLLYFLPVGGYAQEIAKVNVPEQIKLADTALVLNGAGIRTKFFFDIYVGALYLSQKTKDAETAINMGGPKRVLMHFLYDEVTKEKLIAGWNDGFENNHTHEQFEAFKAKLEAFNKLFNTVKRDDYITLDYLPESGAQVSVNDKIKGVIPGEEFYSALLRVWLGKYPADSGLKNGMLGDE